MFLISKKVGIKGLAIPGGVHKIVDVQLVYDTSLYLVGTMDNLTKAKKALEVFCKRLQCIN